MRRYMKLGHTRYYVLSQVNPGHFKMPGSGAEVLGYSTGDIVYRLSRGRALYLCIVLISD